MTAIRPAEGHGHASILGVGGYRPARVVTNAEICEQIDSTDEWIRERSGIAERRHAAPGETVVDMAVAAAEKALAASGITADRLDAVVVGTVTHLYQTPAAATLIAHRLGADSAAAFDISAACAGFCHGLAVANDLVRGGSARHVLVIGVERLTDMIDPTDRGTAFIFGDGAGAAVVGPSAEPGIGPVVWGADGGQAEAITQNVSWDALREDPGHAFPTLSMNGQQVFRWAVFAMAPVAQEALDRAGVAAERPGRVHPAPGQPAHRRGDDRRSSACPSTSSSPATSSRPATRRRPRSRWPWSACSAAARSPAAASRS